MVGLGEAVGDQADLAAARAQRVEQLRRTREQRERPGPGGDVGVGGAARELAVVESDLEQRLVPHPLALGADRALEVLAGQRRPEAHRRRVVGIGEHARIDPALARDLPGDCAGGAAIRGGIVV